MAIVMRAKMKVVGVGPLASGNPSSQSVAFSAVYKDSYDDSGEDEDNTYARWTPQASFSVVVCNPNLIGQFELGDTFYVDFTPVNGQKNTEAVTTPVEVATDGYTSENHPEQGYYQSHENPVADAAGVLVPATDTPLIMEAGSGAV